MYHVLKKTHETCWDMHEGWMGIPWFSIRSLGLGWVREKLDCVPIRSIYDGLRKAVEDEC